MTLLLIQNNKIQNALVHKVAGKLSTTLNSKVTVGYISLDMLNRLSISDLYVEDWRKDTLLFSKTVLLDIDNISLRKKTLKIEKLELDKAYIHFYIDSLKGLNLACIIDHLLANSDSTKEGWDISFDNIGFNNSHFRLENSEKSKKDTGINFSEMNLNDLNIRVKNLKTGNGGVSFKINKLSCVEASGFALNNLTGLMAIKKNMMHFYDLAIHTKFSDIAATWLFFDFREFKDFKYFDERVKFDAAFIDSKVSFRDITYFAPSLWGMNQSCIISGTVKGKLNDLRCKQLELETGKTSIFRGNVSVTGLPDIKSSYIYVDSKELMVLISDVEDISLPGAAGNKIELNKYIRKIGFVNFKGNFTGFINDFVTYGTIKTQLGTIKADLSLKPASKSNIGFNGTIVTEGFNAGMLLPEESMVGLIDLSLTAKGTIADSNKVSGDIDCKIDKIQYNNITFTGIVGKGTLQNEAFDGSVSISNPLIAMNAIGHFSFSKNNPEFNFKAELSDANLQAISILPNDSIQNASCQVNANFKGNSINRFDGIIKIDNISLKKKDKSLLINNLTINTQDNNLAKEIQIRSDVADIDIFGEYNLGDLGSALINTYKVFMPGSFYNIEKTTLLSSNQFMFNAKTKNTNAIFDFFAPELRISPNTKLNGLFYPADTTIRLTIQSNYFQSGSLLLDTLNIHIAAKPDSLVAFLQSKNLTVGKMINLQQFKTSIITKNDSGKMKIQWIDSAKNVNRLNIVANYLYPDTTKAPELKIEALPSHIVMLDSTWDIDHLVLLFDSSSISVPNILIRQNKHQIAISGKISYNETDTLRCDFSNFDLSLLNFILRSENFKFDGDIDGQLFISDFYKSQLTNSKLRIRDFSINNEIIGNTNISIVWDKPEEKVQATATAFRDGIKTLGLDGDYALSSKNFDFSIDIKDIGLKIFQPVIQNVFSLHKGDIKGHITLSGTPDKPVLDGTLNVDSAKFTFKLLNTTYSFDNKIDIVNNNFVIRRTDVFDENKNPLKLWGSVTNNYFKSLSLNINLDLDNNLAVNTLPNGGLPFYGKGFASGKVLLSGPISDLKIDVTEARTEKNTVIALPLSQKGDLTTNEFIRFNNKSTIKKDSSKTATVHNYEIKKSGIILNIDLDVTSDAEVQLVFDPKIGDVMRSRGAGNLKFGIDKTGTFEIWGNYSIVSGDYLFTLQNLINKKFILQNGGTIVFNGDPLGAILDVQAVYRTKASLYGLLGDVNYKPRIPVDCRLFIAGKLQNPDISFDIDLPNASEVTKNDLQSAINNEQEMSQQFISLLVINNFLPSANSNTTIQTNNTNFGKDMATTTSLELLSNQLSNWISQASNDFDIGVSYRPGDQVLTTQEVELALSTQLLNDRVTINGNLDVVGKTDKTQSDLVGDVEVEFQLTDKIKLKAFNRSNDMIQFSNADERYTKGIGIVYREEFADFAELRKRYFQRKKQDLSQENDSTRQK